MTAASSTSFYVDPTSPSWQAPNLIGDLIATPTLEHLQPLERQATIAGYKGYRFGIPIAEIQAAGDERGQVEAVLARLQPAVDELART